MANSQDTHYLSLLALAERFRIEDPPNIRACIQCLQAVLTFQPPAKVEARTHLQLGILLLQFTTNTNLAKENLEQAWKSCINIPGFDDVKFEAASKLAKLYEDLDQSSLAKGVLHQAIELSHSNMNWHSTLLIQSAQISLRRKEFSEASSLLHVGLEYCHMQGNQYNRNIFSLSKLMVLMIEGRSTNNEIQALLSQANQAAEQYTGHPYNKEQLKVYFLILFVCHNLNTGQVRSVKPALIQLQQSIQKIAEHCDTDPQNTVNQELLMLLPRDQLCILVYLVSVMHSVQAGYMDKAQKYTAKALSLIAKLKGSNDYKKILEMLEILLIEHNVICHLITGNKASAIKDLAGMCTCLRENSSLLQKFEGEVHVLLAIYSMSMNDKQAAELQFNTALKLTENRDVWSFVNLNLALVHLRWPNEQDFEEIMNRIQPETLDTQSHSLKAAAYYVQGLHSFFDNKFDNGKRFLRESLKMANAEDLNRLTSCSLVLLGHIFLALGSPREGSNMVTPAMQLASKIPDLNLQLWASAILEMIYRQFGDTAQEQEYRKSHENFSESLHEDYKVALHLPEHQLISWTEGPIPTI